MPQTDTRPGFPIGLYERMGEPLTQAFATLLLDRLMPLADRSLIDIAAGTGGLALAAIERGARVLATDINPAMVGRASERLRSVGAGDAKIMDFTALDVSHDRFDVALSNFGILGFPTWPAGLAEMVRVTRPGGRIGLTMWTHEDDCSPAHVMRRVFNRLFPGGNAWPADLFPLFSERSISEHLRDAGGVDVTIEVAQAEWTSLSSADVVRDFDPVFKFFPGYDALDADKIRRLHSALQLAFNAYAGSDGTIRLPTRAFLATARKAG
ncbi:class I SAM-dependent methyltransferase [Jiella mangrovi]|uniref:Methyltransferase domain-containing protein n=1 Tax=Jiella mangrovi TaxID=2821407 RepID=A0ABS4BI98_9HYPH|nr:methyltransferase domain-containing protein [Jiella mangrovi]MBP0615769.1 methyltransferase domain-containing protein [Jiella mangrovi]